MSRCRVLALLGLVPFGLVRAPDLQTGPAPATVEEVAPLVSVVFEGIVFDSDGAPAEGALVVTSAGGRALTDGTGTYRLDVEVSVEASNAEITAFGGENGELVATRSVSLSAGGLVPMQPLELAQGASQPSWLGTFGGEPTSDEAILALATFDDGGGPALYAGGYFTRAGMAASKIAKWDGTQWTALGEGLTTPGSSVLGFTYVSALQVFDDGSGPALYAGGRFTRAGDVAANNMNINHFPSEGSRFNVKG